MLIQSQPADAPQIIENESNREEPSCFVPCESHKNRQTVLAVGGTDKGVCSFQIFKSPPNSRDNGPDRLARSDLIHLQRTIEGCIAEDVQADFAREVESWGRNRS